MEHMKRTGWRVVFLVAVLLALVLADAPDLKSEDAVEKVESKESEIHPANDTERWGGPRENILGHNNQNYPQVVDTNEYGYSHPGPISQLHKPKSKLIPSSELIYPHTIPGAANVVACFSEGELHNFWSPTYQCLVCVCTRQQGWLRPVCASCSGCIAPVVPSTENVIIPEEPTLRPFFPPTSEVITTTEPIDEDVTCKPLPSGQPFENPLHPCQVCICIESINAYGRPDVQIKCQENPQCVLPTDAPVPVIPTPDVPVPSPHCDQFPVNVVFPHPADNCKICHCYVGLSQLGVQEKLLICLTNPECIKPEPENLTEGPFDIVTPVPSWAPATVKPHRGPLPGPSPHDSCQPFMPNQPFQHPWDECQMCVCTEAFDSKRITIEVSCFTKMSCCIEPPFDLVATSIPVTIPQQPSAKLRVQDVVCEFKKMGVEFVHPNDPCKICSCELQGLMLTAVCKRSSSPTCQPFIGSNPGLSISQQNANYASTAQGFIGSTPQSLGWNIQGPGQINQQQLISSIQGPQNAASNRIPGLGYGFGSQGNAVSSAQAQGYLMPAGQNYHQNPYQLYQNQGLRETGYGQASAQSFAAGSAGYQGGSHYPQAAFGGQVYPPWNSGHAHAMSSSSAQANAYAVAMKSGADKSGADKSGRPESSGSNESSKKEK